MAAHAKSSATLVLEVGRAKAAPQTGLDSKKRAKAAASLSEILGHTYALLVKTQVIHWNVTGPLFRSIHLLTEEQYQALFAAVDEIAERIRALGDVAPVSSQSFEMTAPSSGTTALDMINELIEAHQESTQRLREVAAAADEDEDFVTHDMLTRYLEFHEKAIWMLRAITTGN